MVRAEFAYLSYVLDITLLISVGTFVGKTAGTLRQIQLAIKSTNTDAA